MALQPIDRLREDLSQIQQVLLDTRVLPFPPETQQVYLSSAQQLADKLERLSQRHLTVGLLGGTGVGKSTLMNALAGSTIASTDHRRPHTDQVLIYHHAGEPIPTAITQSQVTWRGFSHEANDIRHIILCDLPDFDSLITRNRDLVVDFLDHLDLLVWATSPEKYADARFYEFLALVPKAEDNFVFVLNKVDLLFANDTPTHHYESLEKLVNRFQDHVVRHGISHPLIFAVSARRVEAGGGDTPWNQFPVFRRYLFQQRDVKEIVAIKAANLDEEIQRLVDRLRGEFLALSRAVPVIQRLIEAFSEDAAECIVSGRLALDHWIQQDLRPEVDRRVVVPSLLVGPGRALMALVHGWHDWRQLAHAVADQAACQTLTGAALLPQGLTTRLRSHLQHQEDRLSNALLRAALPTSLVERLVTAMDLESGWQQFTLRVRNTIETALLPPTQPQRSWALVAFRCSQYLAYGALTLLFLVIEGGEGLWMRLFRQPAATTAVNVVLSIFNSLFSPSGLAALGTLGVLYTLLAIRFYRQYKKLLRQQTQKIIDSLKNEAGSHWEALVRRVVAVLTQFQHELQQPVTTFSQTGRQSAEE